MMVMLLPCGCRKACQLVLNRVAALHCRQKLLAVQLTPRRGDNDSRRVMLLQHRDRLFEFCLAYPLGVRQHNAPRVLHLIVEELAEILHIHLALVHVHNRCKPVQNRSMRRNVLHRADDIGKLADPRRLDQNAVGLVLGQHLFQRLAEVADQRAADAPAVHLANLNPRILHESAVNADLTELVFNQHQLFPAVSLLDQLLNQRGLARSQKA